MAKTLQIFNPASGEVAGSVTCADAASMESALSDARVAQRRWAALRFPERAAVIARFHDLILQRSGEILDVVQSETGKARRDAFAEIVSVAGTARYYLSHGEQHLAGKRRESAIPAITHAEVRYRPLGLIGLITPWNYPFLLPVGDAIPALLAGNAVAIKPAELTPLSAELARRLLIEAGLDAALVPVLPKEASTPQA